MLFSSRVAILVWIGLSVVIGGFLIDATKTNTEGGTIAVMLVVALLCLPVAAWVFKKVKGGRY